MKSSIRSGPFELIEPKALPPSGGAEVAAEIPCADVDRIVLFINYTRDGAGGRPILRWSVNDGLGGSFDESAAQLSGHQFDVDALSALFPSPTTSFAIKYAIDVSDYFGVTFRVAEEGNKGAPGDIAIRYVLIRSSY